MNKLFVSAALASLLAVGCAPSTKVVASPPELVKPPIYLLEDCRETPANDIKTNYDLVRALQNARLDLDLCNTKIKAIREWYDSLEMKVNKKE